jgi:hypothetical protein
MKQKTGKRIRQKHGGSFITDIPLYSSNPASQQVTEKINSSQVLKAKLDGKRMTFVAQAANPARGVHHSLTNLYDLQLKGDTLVAALPFSDGLLQSPVNMLMVEFGLHPLTFYMR